MSSGVWKDKRNMLEHVFSRVKRSTPKHNFERSMAMQYALAMISSDKSENATPVQFFQTPTSNLHFTKIQHR